jgi:sugar/nucleoside kinase (ribokinase family)
MREHRRVLCALGDLVDDVVVTLSALPRRGTDTPAVIRHRRGGSAANVAAAAARCGVAARFLGAVGDDALGERLVADLRGCGVDVRVQRRGRTGTIVVLVEPDGERTMLPDRGACTTLDHVPDEWLTDVDVLHVPAYSLVAEPLASAARSAWLRSAGGLRSIDASSVALVEEVGVDRFRSMLAEVAPDVLLANGDEAWALDLDRPVPGVATTVVKHGADPVQWRDGDGPWRHVAVPPLARVVDTTGAGDAFAAGFLAARRDRQDTAAAVVEGIRVAQGVLADAAEAMEAQT